MAEEKYPYISQFCLNGGCEGVIALNKFGTRMPTCGWDLKYIKCTHKCHEITAGLAEMAAEMGRTYSPPPPPVAEQAPEVAAIAAKLVEIRKPLFAETPTGRLASGQLDQLVYEALKGPLAGREADVSDLVFEVSLAHRGYQPSPGAIQAVLERWAKLSYVRIAVKPIRVTQVYQALHDSRSGPKFGLNRPRLG